MSNSNHSNRTKVCIIENCNFSKGTRLPIRMFKVPENDEKVRRESWEQSFELNGLGGKIPLKGMICVNHFRETDLIPATKSRPIKLKTGAVPKIFNGETGESQRTEPSGPIERAEISCTSCASCGHFRTKYKELCNEKLHDDVKMQHMENQIARLEARIKEQSNHIKCLDMKIKRLDVSKAKLKQVLAELQHQSLLNKDALDILEVSYMHKNIGNTGNSSSMIYNAMYSLKYVEKWILHLNYAHFPHFQKIDSNEVIQCLMNGVKPGEKYSEEVRKFCLTLTYHSPMAYEVVRKKFDNNLPHQRTIRAWFAKSDLDGEPGLSARTLKRLKSCIEDMDGEPLLCTIVFDEMYIREQILWDDNKMNYVGFISYGSYGKESQRNQGEKDKKKKGTTKPNDNIPFAKKALNFMLTGINRNFQFPLAYHLVRDLKADELKALVSEYIIKVSECGIKIAQLSFDGDPKNIAICKLFGANLDALDANFKPYIENPFDKSIIFLTLDPSHMEKLMRNLLGNHQVLFTGSGKRIEWKYFVDLEKLSKGGSMLTHKLNKKHIEFKQNKMNVRLACETFSQSTADSMRLLKNENHPKFLNCEHTIEFTDMMDKLFNVLNSKTKRHENIFKRALSSQNKDFIFDFAEKTIEYLKSLKKIVIKKVNGGDVKRRMPVLKTINKTPVLGFIMNLTNLRLFYEMFVETNKTLDEVYTITFSEDPVEILHAKLRSRNGHNTNPNVIQYKGAFRRVQCNSAIKAPESANCLAFDLHQMDTFSPESDIYFISSRRPKLDILNDEVFKQNLQLQGDLIQDEMELNEIEGIEEHASIIDGLAGASIAYAARLIERKIETKDFYCDCCKYIFSENLKLTDPFIHTIESKRPCSSTYYICKIVDRFLKHYKPKFIEDAENGSANEMDGKDYEKDFRVVFYMIFKEIDLSKVYELSDFLGHEEHKFHLIKCIVREYIRIKTSQISKQITLGHQDKLLRTKLTRWIHFVGQ